MRSLLSGRCIRFMVSTLTSAARFRAVHLDLKPAKRADPSGGNGSCRGEVTSHER
jgi:chorismate mutase